VLIYWIHFNYKNITYIKTKLLLKLKIYNTWLKDWISYIWINKIGIPIFYSIFYTRDDYRFILLNNFIITLKSKNHIFDAVTVKYYNYIKLHKNIKSKCICLSSSIAFAYINLHIFVVNGILIKIQSKDLQWICQLYEVRYVHRIIILLV